MEPNATQITNNIWLGNYKSAYDYKFLNNNNIKYVINVTPDYNKKFNDINYIDIPIKNKMEYSDILKSYIQPSFLFIDNAVNNNHNVLVYCKRGHKRSATVLVYYLTRKYNLSIDNAKNYIRYLRPLALHSKLDIEHVIL